MLPRRSSLSWSPKTAPLMPTLKLKTFTGHKAKVEGGVVGPKQANFGE
jgi:hypothetical protein